MLSQHYVINVNNEVFWTLNKKNRRKLHGLLIGVHEYYTGSNISDAAFAHEIYDIGCDFLTFQRIPPSPKFEGSFFDKYNNTEIDLKSFGIYKQNDVTPQILEEQCLVKSLEELGCNNIIIQDIKLKMRNNEFPRHKIKDIAIKYDLCIRIRSYQNNKMQTIIYGNKNSKKSYEIGLINNHYFAIKEVDMTLFALENYHMLMSKVNGDFNKIRMAYNVKANANQRGNKINSFIIIKYMLEHEGYLIDMKINDILLQSTVSNSKIKLESLEYNEEASTLINEFKERDENTYDVVFADYEAHTVDKIYLNENNEEVINKKFVQDTLGYTKDDKAYVFNGKDCGLDFLNTLKRDTILIFHNASYDFTFIIQYLFNDRLVMKGKRLIVGSFKFKNKNTMKTINIKIIDSYLMISKKLSDFGDMFKIPIEKEVISHKYYQMLFDTKRDNVMYQDIDEALTYLDKDEQKVFINNINRWKLRKNNKFDAMGYRNEYCKMDCLVLKAGYECFAKSMKKIADLDILNYPTLASISYDHLMKTGCYEDVYQLSGIPREFIQKCNVGGRTMCAENKKQYLNKIIADFDAVSLYPSAMARNGRIPKR